MNNKKYKIIFPILAGFLAGVIAVLFFGEHYFNKWYLERIDFDKDDEVARIVIQSPEKVEVTQDLRTTEVIKQVNGAMISVYRKKKAGNDIVSQIYQQKDLLSFGVALTSDGWLVTALESVEGLETGELVVMYNNQIIEVGKKVEDLATSTALLKVEVVDLPVMTFGTLEDITIGKQLLGINAVAVDLLNLSRIGDLDKEEVFHSSEKYYQSLFFDGEMLPLGSAVVNFQGDLIGIIIFSDQNLSIAFPMTFLRKSVNMILRDGDVNYSYLGAHFIEIAAVSGLNQQITKGLEAGALLYGRGSMRAINTDSPLSGILLEGDIITSVAGQKIDNKNSLTELILNSRSGEEIELKYVRESGKEEIVKITLK